MGVEATIIIVYTLFNNFKWGFNTIKEVIKLKGVVADTHFGDIKLIPFSALLFFS